MALHPPVTFSLASSARAARRRRAIAWLPAAGRALRVALVAAVAAAALFAALLAAGVPAAWRAVGRAARAVLSSGSGDPFAKRPDEGFDPGGARDGRAPCVVRVSLHGRIDEATAAPALDALRRAAADPGVAGVLLDVDSPGGDLAACDEIRAAVRALRAAPPARRGAAPRFAVALLGAEARGGAYAAAAEADRVVARPTTETGGLAVSLDGWNVANAARRWDVSLQGASAAPLLGDLSPLAVPDPARERRLSDLAAALGEALSDEIVRARGLPCSTDEDLERLERLFDGRTLDAEQALALGLVDAVGGAAEADAAVRALLSRDEAPAYRVYAPRGGAFAASRRTLRPRRSEDARAATMQSVRFRAAEAARPRGGGAGRSPCAEGGRVRALPDGGFAHLFEAPEGGRFAFVVSTAIVARVLVVGGGGAGGSTRGGGGGAGGVVEADGIVLAPGRYTVVVGAGGKARNAVQTGLPGEDSALLRGSAAISNLVARGGGGGGCRNTQDLRGGDGGSGGGGGPRGAAGASVAGQGFAGGAPDMSGNSVAAGGGGASAAGGAARGYDHRKKDQWGGAGGDGVVSTISGRLRRYGGGGGGGSLYDGGGGTGGEPGAGGGGAGGGSVLSEDGRRFPRAAQSGRNGTGGGGGGGGDGQVSSRGGDGGSGVVVVRYALARDSKLRISRAGRD